MQKVVCITTFLHSINVTRESNENGRFSALLGLAKLGNPKTLTPVYGPPLRTGSVDYLRTGPRTTPTDPSTDHLQNKI